MTKLLDKAFAKAQALPGEDQDALAIPILNEIEFMHEPLDDETRAAIQEGLEQRRDAANLPPTRKWKAYRLLERFSDLTSPSRILLSYVGKNCINIGASSAGVSDSHAPNFFQSALGRCPYLIYWGIEADEVMIVHIRHAARWPWPEDDN